MSEGVLDNIVAWQRGDEKLDVRALYDELWRIYGPQSPTNYCALLLLDMCTDPEITS